MAQPRNGPGGSGDGFHYGGNPSNGTGGTGGTGGHQKNPQGSLPPLNTQLSYTFENFFHPLIGELIARLNQTSVAGMLDPAFLQSRATDFFTQDYPPLPPPAVTLNYSPKTIDVQLGGPYASYNWELLYHIPVAIAVHLSKNQRFAEAQKWFHYVFDPTSQDTTDPVQARYWKFLGFRQESRAQATIDTSDLAGLLALLSDPRQSDEQQLLLDGYDAINKKPFQPHAVARTRTVAYKYYVVMKYLDNLIAWGDSLFLQDTIETINEATLCYVLAANILGPRPQQLPMRGTITAQNFAQLKKAGLDKMGDTLVELEGQFPFNLTLPSTSKSVVPDQSGALFGIGQTLYFCIPRNNKLLAYWDTVADRLFKIRHCMNIEGIVRPLALFDAPIDPGMLAKAAAVGIDIGSIVSGLNQPLGPVRSLTLIQKALEICGEVRSLGNALLSALEKGDSELLAALRQSHEGNLQQMMQNVRFLQWQSVQQATQSLLTSRATALERLHYYQRLLGLPADKNAPDSLALDRRELTEENFNDAYNVLVGQYDLQITLQTLPNLQIAGSTSPSQQSGVSGQGNLYLNTNEDAELNTHLPTARDTRLHASIADTIASILVLLPGIDINLDFWGLGPSSNLFDGIKISQVSRIAADILRTRSAYEQDQAGLASRTASYQRRADDWMFQYNLAAHELMQIGRQILTSLIAEQIAYHEYTTAKTQVSQAEEVQTFLQGISQTTKLGMFVPGKVTTQDLYNWMQGEISQLYYQYYRFAVDTARKAEQTMKQELMRPELDATTFVQSNYWNTGRQGLLSGEALYLDVKRMEMAHHDSNKREFELTRHVSLRQLDPLALLELKVKGSGTFSIPEWFYDRDCPGHYMRRIKTVGASFPSVVGPYTTVNCALTLQRSSVRVSPLLNNGAYGRDLANSDDRFVDYFGSTQTIVTSGASNDSGTFETNLRDERFLPFEGAGAISTWSLSLPSQFRAFDYMTISDVILHVRYTARDGGANLGNQATQELGTMFDTVGQSLLTLLFSLRYDFPTEWSAFVNGTDDFIFTLRKDYFPYMAQSGALTVDGLTLYAQNGDKLAQTTLTVPPNLSSDLNSTSGVSLLSFPADQAVLTRNPQAQVFLIVQYHLGS